MTKRPFIETIYGQDGVHPDPYLTRIGWDVGLKLHIFHRGDKDPDFHDHQWDFWTFPLTSYVEEVLQHDGTVKREIVRAFRLHRRPAEHRHRVVGRAYGVGKIVTLCWSGPKRKAWSFFVRVDQRHGLLSPVQEVPWRDYVFGSEKWWEPYRLVSD